MPRDMPRPSTAAPARAAPPKRRAKALFDLRALEAFVAVCEDGSMLLAGRRLGVSQSAISQLLKSLEQDLGAPLLDRDVRPARPTRAGGELLGLAAALLGQARTLKERMRVSARQSYAQIRLGCVDSFAATVGPALIQGLSGAARQIQLLSGLTPALSAQLQGRELDLAICTESDVTSARIRQQPLFSEALVAVFPRVRGTGKLTKPRDLPALAAALPLIRYSQRSVIGQQIERYLRHAGLEAPRRFEFDATDPLLSLVAAGLGWALSTPLCLWQSRQYLGEVSVLPLPATRLGRREFFLLTHAGEATELADEITRLTLQVLRKNTVPSMRSLMPALPDDMLTYPTQLLARGTSGRQRQNYRKTQ